MSHPWKFRTRGKPLARRKAALTTLLKVSHPGIRPCEHLEFDDGAMFYEHACAFGCEGIVSKRLGSRYRSGGVARLDQDQESQMHLQ